MQSTQQNWSEGDFLALLAQQNWSMFYQSGTEVYIPRQTPFHPTYSLGEEGRSRGTGYSSTPCLDVMFIYNHFNIFWF